MEAKVKEKISEPKMSAEKFPEWYSELPPEYKISGDGHYMNVCEGVSVALKQTKIRDDDGTFVFPKIYLNQGKNHIVLNIEQLAFLVHAVDKAKESMNLSELLVVYRAKVEADGKEVKF